MYKYVCMCVCMYVPSVGDAHNGKNLINASGTEIVYGGAGGVGLT